LCVGDDVEVRRYGPRLTAETTVSGTDPETAWNALRAGEKSLAGTNRPNYHRS